MPTHGKIVGFLVFRLVTGSRGNHCQRFWGFHKKSRLCGQAKRTRGQVVLCKNRQILVVALDIRCGDQSSSAWTQHPQPGRFGTRLIKTHIGDFCHGGTTSTSRSVCDAAHEDAYRLMWRGLAPAIMKTLWAGVRAWVGGRTAGGCVGGSAAGPAGVWGSGDEVVRFKKLAEGLAHPNFFKKSRPSADLLVFLFVRGECMSNRAS